MNNTTAFPLPKSWIQIKLPNQQYLFFNTKDEIIAYHPPFPMNHLDGLLNFYDLDYNADEIHKLLASHITNDSRLKNNSSNESRDPLENFTPITDNKTLVDILDFAQIESIEKVFDRVFNKKFGLSPNYEYSCKPKDHHQTCSIKVRDYIFLVSDIEDTKAKSKENAERKGFQMLVPSIYNQLINKSNEDNTSASSHSPNTKKSSSSQHDSNTFLFNKGYDSLNLNTNRKLLLGHKRARSIDNENNEKNSIPFWKTFEPSIYQEEILVFSYDNKLSVKYLSIDDPAVVDNSLHSFSFKPLDMLTIIKNHHPNIDLIINNSPKNYTIRNENMENNNCTYSVVESKMLNIKGEAIHSVQDIAQQYAAQRFLSQVYRGYFTYYSELNKFFIGKPEKYLGHLDFI